MCFGAGSNNCKSPSPGEVHCPAAQPRLHGCICKPGTQQALCSHFITMAAVVLCVRQGVSGFLARAATCAWDVLHQPQCHASRLHGLRLNESETETYSCSASEAHSPSEGVREADSPQHGFMWMGKGDMRTFRGKVSSSGGQNAAVINTLRRAYGRAFADNTILCSSSEAPMGR
jgi:hypothetical protein